MSKRYCENCNAEVRPPRIICEWCEETHRDLDWDDALEWENEQVFQDMEGYDDE